MNKDERARLIRETTSTPGWKIIEEWLNNYDQNITNEIKQRLLTLKWSEKEKWFGIYSGQALTVERFRSFITSELERDSWADKARSIFKKKPTLDE